MTGEEKQRGERTTTVAVGSLAKERRREVELSERLRNLKIDPQKVF